MKPHEASKRRFLKILIGAGLIAPGLASWLSRGDAHGGWDGIKQKMLTNAMPIRHPAVCSRREKDFTILFREENNQDLLKINETAAYIFRMCNGRNRIEDMAAIMSSQFNTPIPTCNRDISFVIRAFRQYDIVLL